MSTVSPRSADFRGHWLLGCLPAFFKDPLQLCERARQEHGDFVRLRIVPGIYAYLLSHPDAVEHVLHKNAGNYRKPGMHTKEMRPLIGNGLFISDGDFWRQQRRLMQPAFHRQPMLQAAPRMVSVADAFVRQHLAADPDRPVDLVQEMTWLALRIVSTALFGSDVLTDDPGQPAQAVVTAYRTAFQFVTRPMRTPFPLPHWLPTPAGRAFARARKVLDRAVQKMIDARHQAAAPPADLLSLILAARSTDGRGGLTDQQVKDEVLTMLTAGHETMASALSWAWYLLGSHPRTQEDLADEVRGRLGGGEASLTADDLPHLPLARAVFEETMRLYPPAWAATRQARSPDTVGSTTIPARSVVIVSQWVTHRHPDFWPEPEQFRPERFLPAQETQRHPYAYFPFGAGPRGCIGSAFAMMKGPLVLATIARRFRVELVSGQAVVPDPTFTLRPRHGVHAFLRPR
jgi:cytochrome P450